MTATAQTFRSDYSMNPEDLASQSDRMTEERLRREQEKLKEIEIQMQKAINEKRQELLVRENELREMEARVYRDHPEPLDAPSASVGIEA